MTDLPPDKLFYENLEVHLHQTATKPSSFVSKLFSKIKGKIFSHKHKQALYGRIQELHLNSAQIREDLEKIKAEVEIDLQPLVLGVIDPMLRNIQHLNHATQHSQSAQAIQEKTVQRYIQWIDQAKAWVQLYAKAKDKDEALKAVIHHIISISHQIIDRDLHILNEYKIQAIELLEKPAEKKETLRKVLYNQIAPFLAKLTELKQTGCPPFQTLKEMSAWKHRMDSLRQENFNRALHVIDTFIERHRRS